VTYCCLILGPATQICVFRFPGFPYFSKLHAGRLVSLHFQLWKLLIHYVSVPLLSYVSSTRGLSYSLLSLGVGLPSLVFSLTSVHSCGCIFHGPILDVSPPNFFHALYLPSNFFIHIYNFRHRLFTDFLSDRNGSVRV
jgi:hypothetical protein